MSDGSPHVEVQLRLDKERRTVLMTLPEMPLVEWDGVPTTGVALSMEAARELAYQLIRWSVLLEAQGSE